MTSGVSCERSAEPYQQQEREDQLVQIAGRQYRSESDDSGQLSLISSFGSISINQIVNSAQHPRFQQRLPSESSQEFTGSNYVDYQQYCSLMLLNSFDCCEEDIIGERYKHHQVLNNSLKSLVNCKVASLAERRARWFAGLEDQKPNIVDEKQAEPLKELKAEQKLKLDGKRGTKKGSKKFVAALAATQMSLMDKFWAHMVRKGDYSTRQQDPSSKTANTSILGDLSRRLVRRCVKTGRAQSDTLEKHRGDATSVGGDKREPVTVAVADTSSAVMNERSILNASISTLNTTTTPSGCCYCDNETCSSSGFVSSSAAAAVIQVSTSPTSDNLIIGTGETILNNNKFISERIELEAGTIRDNLATASPMALTVHQEAPSEQSMSINSLSESQIVDTKQKDFQGNQQQVEDPRGSTKSKGSILNRARNSNLNLSSLAPITQRFSCSASVGNLWASRNVNQCPSPNDEPVIALDYTPNQAFDDEANSCKHHPKQSKPFLSEKTPTSLSFNSSRKSSTKEKCRRQKDAERVEKLRLLVSYLRSGSSQPVVSPVELEADEIELAERYKLQMALRDDLLISSDDHDRQNKMQQNSKGEKKASSAIVRSDASPSSSSCSMYNRHRNSVGMVRSSHDDYIASADSAHPVPRVGQVSWVLRHSISDPGNKYGHNFGSIIGQKSPIGTAHASIVSASSSGHRRNSIDQISSDVASTSFSQVIQQTPEQVGSFKALSANCNNNNNNNNSNNDSSSSSSIIQQHQRPIRLFYIDDFDAPQAHVPTFTPKINEFRSNLVPPTTNNANDSMATVVTQATSSGIFTNSVCSNSSHPTPSVAVPSASTSLSSSKSCSAWTSPQNLATWIDDEVNSLVHDLELNESRQKLSHDNLKHNAQNNEKGSSNNASCKSKEGKRRWLSVTGGNLKRNCSDAHSR